MDHPAQAVAPHGLHHRVTVHPGSEARPHADDHRGIGDPGAQIPLGQDGVHHRVRLQNRDTGSLRVRQHRDYILLQKGHSRLGVSARRAVTSSTFVSPNTMAWEKVTVRRMAVGAGISVIITDICALFQPQSNTGGQITGASDDYQHGKYSLLHRLPARTGQSIRRARALASARFHSVST